MIHSTRFANDQHKLSREEDMEERAQSQHINLISFLNLFIQSFKIGILKRS